MNIKQNTIKLNEEDLHTKLNLEGRNNDLEETNFSKTKQNKKCECPNPQGNGNTPSREGFKDLSKILQAIP